MEGGVGGAAEKEVVSGEGEEGGMDGDLPFEMGGLLVRATPVIKISMCLFSILLDCVIY